MKTQIGVSLDADFSENTWTFEMPVPFSVCAGEFAIVPKAEYDEMVEFMNKLNPSDATVKKYLIQIGSDYFNRIIPEFNRLDNAQRYRKTAIELDKIINALEGDKKYVFLPDEFSVNVNNENIKVYPIRSEDKVEIEPNKPSFNGELLLTLESKNEWVRKVPHHLPEKNYHNEHFIWIDANGNTLAMGEDFAAAEKIGSYPVKVYRHTRVSDVARENNQTKEQ